MSEQSPHGTGAPEHIEKDLSSSEILSPDIARAIATQLGLNETVASAFAREFGNKDLAGILESAARIHEREFKDQLTGLNKIAALQEHVLDIEEQFENVVDTTIQQLASEKSISSEQVPFQDVYQAIEKRLTVQQKNKLDEKLQALPQQPDNKQGHLLVKEFYVRSEFSRCGIFYGDMIGLKNANDFQGLGYMDRFGFAKWGRHQQVLDTLTNSRVYDRSVSNFDSEPTNDYLYGENVIIPAQIYYQEVTNRLHSAGVDIDLLRSGTLMSHRRESSADEGLFFYMSSQVDESGRPLELQVREYLNTAKAIKAVSRTVIGEYSIEQKKIFAEDCSKIFGARNKVEPEDREIGPSVAMRLGYQNLAGILEPNDPTANTRDKLIKANFNRFIDSTEDVMKEEKKKEGTVVLYEAINGIKNSQITVEVLRRQNRLSDTLDSVNLQVLFEQINKLPPAGEISWEDYISYIIAPAQAANKRGVSS